jgi:hypothetical protein
LVKVLCYNHPRLFSAESDKRGIIITVSNQAANIVGKLSKWAIAMLPQAEYSVIRQEGECGYTTNALT